MRTNIVLNDNLLKEAFRYTSVSTKRELIELALQEFVVNHRRRDIRELKGKIALSADYDYKKLRAEKDEE
jgi:Arc/MetJ family transcription regulator